LHQVGVFTSLGLQGDLHDEEFKKCFSEETGCNPNDAELIVGQVDPKRCLCTVMLGKFDIFIVTKRVIIHGLQVQGDHNTHLHNKYCGRWNHKLFTEGYLKNDELRS
jgi:hypothetical protein